MPTFPSDAPAKLTLFDHEARLLDALELIAYAENEGREPSADLLGVVKEYVLQAAEKRDRVAFFLRECEARAELYAVEIHRMQRRKATLEAAAERLKGYVVQVMESVGALKLEGQGFTLSTAKNPDSVRVDGDVPTEYERVIPERREPDKVKIKDALKEGKTIPNCRLVEGGKRLVIR